jgi:predicted DNA-binding transcriptional regulator AlpA
LTVAEAPCSLCLAEEQALPEKDMGRKQLEMTANRRNGEVVTFAALLVLLDRRSRQSIYDLMRRDPSFPRPLQLGSPFSIGWLRHEIIEWLGSCPRVEWNGLDAIQRRKNAGVKRRDHGPAIRDTGPR